MRTALAYDPWMARYDFGAGHPLSPARFTLAMSLAEAVGLCGDAAEQAHAIQIGPASEAQLARIHTASYLATVREASADPRAFEPSAGIGPGDTPAFAHMHDVSALIAGGTIAAADAVMTGRARNAFAPAGGLHHAHRERAAGFCVYNDVAIAIAHLAAENPGVRIAYVDIDAHHGDGVQEAFETRDDVLTISLHESGRFLYPGTGTTTDIGVEGGRGFALNLPLPPGAGDGCAALAFAEAIGPAVRAFEPDIVVAQLGADGHRDDPLTHLQYTVRGHHALVADIVRLAEEVCDGRLVATGGGGYDTYSAVPRAWTAALAELLGAKLPDALPERWQERATRAGGRAAPEALFEERTPDLDETTREALLGETRAMLRRARLASPLLDAATL